MTTASTLRKYQDIIEGNSEGNIEEVTESVHLTPYLNNTQIIRRYQDILMEADLEATELTWPKAKKTVTKFLDTITNTWWMRSGKSPDAKIYKAKSPSPGDLWSVHDSLKKQMNKDKKIHPEQGDDGFDGDRVYIGNEWVTHEEAEKIRDRNIKDVYDRDKGDLVFLNGKLVTPAEYATSNALANADQSWKKQKYDVEDPVHLPVGPHADKPEQPLLALQGHDTELATSTSRMNPSTDDGINAKPGEGKGKGYWKGGDWFPEQAKVQKDVSPYARAGIGKFTGGKTLAGKKIDPNERWLQNLPTPRDDSKEDQTSVNSKLKPPVAALRQSETDLTSLPSTSASSATTPLSKKIVKPIVRKAKTQSSIS
jgi:hypothetical protein